MGAVTAVVAVLSVIGGGVGGGVVTKLVTAWFNRGRVAAQIQQITNAAHTEIYEQYGTLIKELRQDAELAREEARGARHEAREAQLRATEAEARAAGAENRATAAEAQLSEMRKLVQMHVPDADVLMRGFAQLARAAATREAAGA